MKIQIFFRTILALIGILLSPFVHADQKYNVLFIAIDDLRPELGCYGHPLVKSPNIDRLAQSSLLFNRAYCQFALCNPSRASLLSGRRPETIKVFDLETFLRKDNPDIVTLPQMFKNNGYRTLHFGKIFHTTNGNHDDSASWEGSSRQSVQSDPDEAGKKKNRAKVAKNAKPSKSADHSRESPWGAPDVEDAKMTDGKIVLQAIQSMREIKDKPFFLAVGFHRPHMPFVAPKKYWDLYDAQKIPLAANPFYPKDAPLFANNDASELRRYKGVSAQGPISEALARQLIHGYFASTSFVDAQIGKLLGELDDLGLRDKTIVILWGDHGYHLGEHGTWNKRTDWEIATRVPLLVSVPKQKTAGKKTEALVEFVDIYPTLAELCRLTPPAGLEGVSFAPLLENEKRSWKTAAFSLYVKNIPELGAGDAFGRTMRTDRYRFTEWNVPGNEKRVYELYDHEVDPQENVNIADHGENKQLVASLAAQLKQGWKAAVPR